MGVLFKLTAPLWCCTSSALCGGETENVRTAAKHAGSYKQAQVQDLVAPPGGTQAHATLTEKGARTLFDQDILVYGPEPGNR